MQAHLVHTKHIHSAVAPPSAFLNARSKQQFLETKTVNLRSLTRPRWKSFQLKVDDCCSWWLCLGLKQSLLNPLVQEEFPTSAKNENSQNNSKFQNTECTSNAKLLLCKSFLSFFLASSKEYRLKSIEPHPVLRASFWYTKHCKVDTFQAVQVNKRIRFLCVLCAYVATSTMRSAYVCAYASPHPAHPAHPAHPGTTRHNPAQPGTTGRSRLMCFITFIIYPRLHRGQKMKTLSIYHTCHQYIFDSNMTPVKDLDAASCGIMCPVSSCACIWNWPERMPLDHWSSEAMSHWRSSELCVFHICFHTHTISYLSMSMWLINYQSCVFS